MSWVAVSKTQHSQKAIKQDKSFLFAKNIQFVPVCNFEIYTAVNTTPLFFLRLEEQVRLVCLLGLEKNTNLFVSGDGRWRTKFIPAIFQAYPFSFGAMENGGSALLCKEEAECIVDRKQGEPFFNEDGSEGKVLKDYIQLLAKIKQSTTDILKACSLLTDLDLLKPLDLEIKKLDGKLVNIKGLLTIKEDEFRDLKGDKFLELRDKHALHLVYAHWCSINFVKDLILAQNQRDQNVKGLEKLGSEIFENNSQEISFDAI